MKLITAVIRPSKLEEVWIALAEIGIKGMTVTDVRGCGRNTGYVEHYRGENLYVEFLAKIKLELAVPDDKSELVIELIHKTAATGEVGDGKIFVVDLENIIRIRTGETQESAL